MKRYWIVYIIVAFIVAACTTKKIAVQVLRPAEVTMPRSVMRVGVVDRTYLAWAKESPIYENGYTTTRFNDLIQIVPQKITEGFIVELSGFKRFATIPIASPELVDTLSKTVPKASQQMLDNIKKDSSLDALVSLEDFRVSISTDGNVYTEILYDAFGNAFTVPRFQGRRIIKITAFWRVYNVRDNTIAHERTIDTELAFSSNGYNPDDSYRRLPEQKGSVENTAQVAGIDYAKTWIPFWQGSERMIYLGQSNAWLDAADSAEVGNWASAADQWKILVKKSPFPVIQRQAVFNLFTAYEVLGNLDESEYWAKLGQKKYKHRDFDAAILFLDKRRIENQKLDEQLNE